MAAHGTSLLASWKVTTLLLFCQSTLGFCKQYCQIGGMQAGPCALYSVAALRQQGPLSLRTVSEQYPSTWCQPPALTNATALMLTNIALTNIKLTQDEKCILKLAGEV
jgi:hypothetical protein